MPKVTIVKPKRKSAKDHSKVVPMHKPASKPKVAKANVAKPRAAK